MHISVYLEERNPAAGEERGGKSVSIQPGKCKFNSPDCVKSFCTQTEGSFRVYSLPQTGVLPRGCLPFASWCEAWLKDL